MKLVDLNPRWVFHGGEGISDKDGKPVPYREKIGIAFDCPCGKEDCSRVFLQFENPPDGEPKISDPAWKRIGESFENMTLSPSIQRIGGCQWHGFLTNGEFKRC